MKILFCPLPLYICVHMRPTSSLSTLWTSACRRHKNTHHHSLETACTMISEKYFFNEKKFLKNFLRFPGKFEKFQLLFKSCFVKASSTAFSMPYNLVLHVSSFSCRPKVKSVKNVSLLSHTTSGNSNNIM